MTRTVKKTAAATGAKQNGIQGIKDIITQTNPLWQALLKRFQKLGRTYGFQRIETPLLEEVSLYQNYYGKDAGELPVLSLDVAGKPMAIRPSLMPSVLRSYVQHKIGEERPLSKWAYSGNVLYYDHIGKVMSDYEFGLEVLGTFSHLAEVQVISGVWSFVQGLGLGEVTLEINTLGDVNCQNVYQDTLRSYLQEKKFGLCDNCNEALAVRPLNVLRCNNLECQVAVAEAPTILDFLDDASQKRFTNTLESLDELQLPYQLNPLYAGPAGSSNTNFVLRFKQGNKTLVLGEGSYHDDLMKQLTGKAFPAFGFKGSLAVLEQCMALTEIRVQQEIISEVFLVPLGELASKKSLRLFHDLTAADVRVYDHFGTVGVKNQLKQAEEFKSPIALIMGQKEALDEMVILRDVKSGMQEVFSYDKIVEEVKKRLGR